MILSCQNIEKAFLEKQILKNCSFHIEDYEKAAIVGLNGAGKTTLLRIIVGQLEPDGGVVALQRTRPSVIWHRTAPSTATIQFMRNCSPSSSICSDLENQTARRSFP